MRRESGEQPVGQPVHGWGCCERQRSDRRHRRLDWWLGCREHYCRWRGGCRCWWYPARGDRRIDRQHRRFAPDRRGLWLGWRSRSEWRSRRWRCGRGRPRRWCWWSSGRGRGRPRRWCWWSSGRGRRLRSWWCGGRCRHGGGLHRINDSVRCSRRGHQRGHQRDLLRP